jgi:hypothetical protein
MSTSHRESPHRRRSQLVWRLLSRSPERRLATVPCQLDYDEKDARGTGDRKEDKPRIGAMCHRSTNGDSVCGRYNSPRRSCVEGAICIGRVRHAGEEERNAQEFWKVVCDDAAGDVPTSRWFRNRGRETTGSKQGENLGVALDANGASAESSRGSMWAAMARLVEIVDAGALARGMRPTGAAHFYDTFVSSVWRHDVLLTPISPADTKMINDLDLLLVTQVLAKVSFTEGNVKIPRSLLRLDSPMLYKR